MKRWMCMAALVAILGNGCNSCTRKQECRNLRALCRIEACLTAVSYDWCTQPENAGKCEQQGAGFVVNAKYLGEFTDACLALATNCNPDNTAGCTAAEKLANCISCGDDGGQPKPPDAAPAADAGCRGEPCGDGTCCAGGSCCAGTCCEGICCNGACCTDLVCGAAPDCRCLSPGEVCNPPPPPDAAPHPMDAGPGPSCPVDLECCRNADCDGNKCCFDPASNTTICASSCPAPKAECMTGLASCGLGACPCR